MPEEVIPPVPDPELARMRVELDKKTRDIESLKKLVMVQPQQQQQQYQQQPQPAANMDELNKQFYKEPVKMAADIATAVAQRAVQEMGQNVANASYDTLKQSAKQLARNQCKNPALFDKYAGEIEAKVMQTHAQYHTSATVWSTAYSNVMGEHMDDIVTEAKQAVGNGGSPAVHISNQGGPQNSRAAQPQAVAEKLTDDERHVAKKLGLTDAEYSKGKKAYATQEKLASKGSSSWDPYITVDTKKLRKSQKEAKRANQTAA